MTGEELRAVFEAVLPREEILATVEKLGIQQRERKLDVVGLVMAMALSGGNHRYGSQAAVMESYVELGQASVSRSGFYQWFTNDLAALMGQMGERACAWAASRPTHLPGILAARTDWRVIDSTTVKLTKALQTTFPGAGDYAALKIHKEHSLGVENIVGYSVSPARDADANHLIVDERRSGQGLIVDLGYASHDLLANCEKHDVHYVIRVKEGWQFWFDGRVGEEERRRWLDDARLGERFKTRDIPRGADDVLDIDVTVGDAMSMLGARLVSFATPNGRVMFLTNLPRNTHSYAEIGLLYRLRWTIELDNKMCKSALAVDEIQSRTESSAMALVHAAMLGAILANAIVHEEHTKRGWTGTRRRAITQPPLHPTQIAKILGRHPDMYARPHVVPDSPLSEWDLRAAALTHLAKDPAWRSSPSAIDVVKGRTHKLLNTHAYALNPTAALRALK